MELKHKSVLLISPEPWDHLFVSKHHYAVHLAGRGNKVFFVGPPSRGFSIRHTEIPDVFQVNYTGFPAGLRFYPRFLQKRIIRSMYYRLARLCATRFDIIWSFDNSVFFDFSALPAGTLKISHIVDLNQNFQTARAASTADYCFCTTALLKHRLSRHSNHVFKIAHGYNALPGSSDFRAAPLAGDVKVVYAGNLAMPYIDWVALRDVVHEHPKVDFYFLGTDGPVVSRSVQADAKAEVRQCANCHFPGKIEAGRLQGYYAQADILLIAYLQEFHDDQANPHKMMEYLASGKVVVATFTSEYDDTAFKELVLMSRDNTNFRSTFRAALSDLAFWNSRELQHARRTFALDNTYEKQIGRIEEIINRK